MKIFVDLDGVLADWLSPALCVMGYEPDAVYAAWDKLNPRPWNVFQVITTSADRGWQAIDLAGDSFWANLPKLSHANALMQSCRSVSDSVTVLTSPSQHPSSYSGKVRWLDHHFGRGFAHSQALLGGCKHVVARPGAVLIDDSPANCSAWEANGGHAILFPAVGNRLHAMRGKPLDYVTTQLEALARPPAPKFKITSITSFPHFDIEPRDTGPLQVSNEPTTRDAWLNMGVRKGWAL